MSEIPKPFSAEDSLATYGILMEGVVDNPGLFRTTGAGVMKGDALVHVAPPPSLSPSQVQDFLSWVKCSEYHLLIKSVVFHYESEYVRPHRAVVLPK